MNIRWIPIATLLVLLSVIIEVQGGFWVQSNPSSKSIDEIITQEYHRLVASGHLKHSTTNEKRSLLKEAMHNHDEEHKECASEKWMRERYANLTSFNFTEELPPQNSHSNLKRASQTMRFYVDNTVLTSGSDPQACYTVGSTIKIGGTYSYTCTSSDLLSSGLIDLINNSLMPTMLTIFSEVLALKSTQVMNPLKLDSSMWNSYPNCDTNVPIPSSYVTTGLSNTDYVIFITARPTQSSGTVAYAGGCNFHQYSSSRYSRPYAGILNLNPRYFQSYVTSMTLFDYKSALKTAMHEVTHALGFSSSFYSSYIDNTTSTYYATSPSFSTTVSGTSPAGNAYSATIIKLRTPNVLTFARDYFNCATLDGVELEDYGGSGTAGSHWERRVCGEEYMTGYVNDQMWMSGFTLSLFQDMGWYDVDTTKVEYLGWGKDQGCAWVQNRCESSWPSASAGYWCSSTSAVQGCTPDRVSVGYCYVVASPTPSPAYYQHFSNPALGGIDSAADFCPYTFPYVSCRDTTQTAKSSYFEVYGESSRCWPVQGSSTAYVCYPYQCISNNTVLQVQINSQWVTCPAAGGSVNVASILGGSTTVNCPTTSLFCRVVDGFQPQVLITDAMLSPGVSSPSPTRTPSPSPVAAASASSTPTRTPSVTPSKTASPSVTPTVTPTRTPSPSPVASVSATPTRTPSVTPSVTPSPSVTPTKTPSPTSSPSTGASPSSTPSVTPTRTPTPSVTPSPTSTPSVTPSRTPSPSSSPSAGASASVTPTRTPSVTPTSSPSQSPGSSPSATPSVSSSPGSVAQPSNSASPSPAKKGGKKSLLEGNNIIIIGAAGGGAVLLLTGAAVAIVMVRRRKNEYKPNYYHDSSTGYPPSNASAPADVPLKPIPVMATSDIQRDKMSQPGQASAPPPVPANPKPPVPSHGNPFPVGSQCKARYTGDGEYYTAVVKAFDPAKGYLVRYPEYGEEEWLPLSSLRK